MAGLFNQTAANAKLQILEGIPLVNCTSVQSRRDAGLCRFAEQIDVSVNDMLAAVRQQQLEGVIGKRKDSLYEAGRRTGSWVKYRINRGQELVIGGYIPGPHGFDSLIVGYYQGKDLMYVVRVRNGFVPESRRQLVERICHLVSHHALQQLAEQAPVPLE